MSATASTFNSVRSPRTPFNRREPRSTHDSRRVFRNGRWMRPDPEASKAWAWLRS